MDFFHVLNRGVDKRKVFLNEKDYLRFIHDLYEFNDTASLGTRGTDRFNKNVVVGRLHFGEERKQPRDLLVKIHCFALMPNHYHLLLSPIIEDGIALFMKKLNGGYARYFNEKNNRTGALWQGGYKSVPIETDAHFNFIPYYIHFNPLDLHTPEWRRQCPAKPKEALVFLENYRWSSHRDYLGLPNFPSVTDRSFWGDVLGVGAQYKKAVVRELGSLEVDEGITLEM